MKLMWFHLMPYTELPDDFREKNPSVWVDIHSSLFDPRRAHHMYNDFMDELEFAAECGFDAVCVNEHHSNGYGLMPSPNLVACVAGAAHHRHGDLRAGQFAGALQPADAGRRRIRDDRLHLGRAADRRVPGRLADGHLLRLRPEPVHAARALSRSARPRGQGVDRAGHLRLQRPLQPAALRQHLAAPDPEAASADLDPGRRLGRDLAVVRRDGLRLLLPVVLRLQGRAGDDDRASGTRWPGSARTATRTAPASCNSSASPRPARRRSSSTPSRPSISTAAACMSTRASPGRRATPPRRPSAAASRAWSRKPPTPAATPALRDQVPDLGARDGCDRRQGLRHHRLARRGRRAADARSRPTSMSAT